MPPRSLCARLVALLMPVALLNLAGPLVAQAPSGNGILQVTVAVVGPNATIRPIPLHQLNVVRVADTGTSTLRTGLDGRAEATLAPGAYTLSSQAPVSIEGIQYSWRVVVQVSSARTVLVELTNANADTVAAGAPAPVSAQRETAPEMTVFGRVRDGVVKVQAGIGHGTAFLVDSAGLFLTSAHVVASDSFSLISVMLDSVTRVPAQLVLSVPEADLAVIRISPSLAAGRPVSRLDPGAAAKVGERVFALGYPKGRAPALSGGIVSEVREGAIITDVNASAGNSGGPLYALDGTIVGVNTLADGSTGSAEGAIPINRAIPVVDYALRRVTALPEPPATLLPVLPRPTIPAAVVKATVKAMPASLWADFAGIDVDRFDLDIQTPFQLAAMMASQQADSAKKQKKGQKPNSAEVEGDNQLRGLHDWDQYTGSSGGMYVAAVAFNITPQTGETSGSMWRRMAIGTFAKATYRYKSDLGSLTVYRNRDIVQPFLGGTQPLRQYVKNQWVDMRDVANTGFYLFPLETFSPEADGKPPAITLLLRDLKHADDPGCRVLAPQLVAAIWNQFELYFKEAGIPFVASDPGKAAPDAAKAAGLNCTEALNNSTPPRPF